MFYFDSPMLTKKKISELFQKNNEESANKKRGPLLGWPLYQ